MGPSSETLYNSARSHCMTRVTAQGRFEPLPRLTAGSPTCGLAQVLPADLDIPILGQLTPS